MGKGKGIYCTCKEAPLRATVSLSTLIPGKEVNVYNTWIVVGKLEQFFTAIFEQGPYELLWKICIA